MHAQVVGKLLLITKCSAKVQRSSKCQNTSALFKN